MERGGKRGGGRGEGACTYSKCECFLAELHACVFLLLFFSVRLSVFPHLRLLIGEKKKKQMKQKRKRRFGLFT